MVAGGSINQPRLQRLQSGPAFNFSAKQVRHVKCVDRPFAIGRNMGAVQSDLGFKQRLRQIIQQRRSVERVDFDHRKAVRCRVFNEDRWCNLKGIRTAQGFRISDERYFESEKGAQRALQAVSLE